MANKKAKKVENSNFKSVKVKNLSTKKSFGQEGDEIKKFVVIFVVVIIIIIGIYFLSTIIVNKRNKEVATEVPGEINYDLVSVGTILNRPYNDYYVVIYNSATSDAIFYSSLVSSYQSKEDALKIYFCDLNNKLNENYVSESDVGNSSARTVDQFMFGKLTLLEINNGQVVRYIEDVDAIKSILE